MTARRCGPGLKCTGCGAKGESLEATGEIVHARRDQRDVYRAWVRCLSCGRRRLTYHPVAIRAAFDVTQGQSVVYEQPALELAS